MKELISNISSKPTNFTKDNSYNYSKTVIFKGTEYSAQLENTILKALLTFNINNRYVYFTNYDMQYKVILKGKKSDKSVLLENTIKTSFYELLITVSFENSNMLIKIDGTVSKAIDLSLIESKWEYLTKKHIPKQYLNFRAEIDYGIIEDLKLHSEESENYLILFNMYAIPVMKERKLPILYATHRQINMMFGFRNVVDRSTLPEHDDFPAYNYIYPYDKNRSLQVTIDGHDLVIDYKLLDTPYDFEDGFPEDFKVPRILDI
jgi:hypothetical protein